MAEHDQLICVPDIPRALFASLPHTSETISGEPMEAVHMIMIRSQE
jgi:hypothetical protein